MKAWTDLSLIVIPPKMSGLPKDARGYPIPHTAATRQDGSRDFTVIDEQASHACFSHDRCGICGDFLGKFKVFVGGPKSIVQRLFSDVWVHRECAEYALKVCPFLAAPSFAYRRAEPKGHEATEVNPLGSTIRPKVFGLGVTKTARYVDIGGRVVMHAGPWVETSWWAAGVQIDQGDVVRILKEEAAEQAARQNATKQITS